MRLNGRHRFMLLLGLTVLACTPVGEDHEAPESLERYLEIELGRLEETYRLLDRFAKDIWPQWDNYHEIEVRIRFPNEVQLLLNPRDAAEQGYERVQGRDVYGKQVFIKREKELPSRPEPPLVVGRGRGGFTIRIDLRELESTGEEPERVNLIEEQLREIDDEETEFSIEPTGDSESYILMLVHEHFHGYQAKHGPREGRVEGLRQFEVNAEYATYSQIEGLALMKASNEEERGDALEFLKDYHVARELKHELMPPEATEGEPYLALAEGLPSYVSLKMAMLIESTGYEPGSIRDSDPFFFDYKYVRSYYENLLDKGMRFAAKWTLDKRGKYYLYGAYQCFLLDRFVPGWKQDFLKNKRNLDELTASFLNLSPAEKQAVSNRLKNRYSYDDLYAQHDAKLKKGAQP